MSHFNASVGPKSHLHIKSRRWDSLDMPIKWSRLCKSMTNSQRKETPNNKFSFGAACSRRLFGCQRRPKKKKKKLFKSTVMRGMSCASSSRDPLGGRRPPQHAQSAGANLSVLICKTSPPPFYCYYYHCGPDHHVIIHSFVAFNSK